MNIRVISVLLCAVCFCSCVERSEYWQTIKSVEPYIEERPDSALVVLQGMNTRKLSEGEERAKYALYLSMAMDNNYIDRTDFDILQPAIDYYKENGSDTDKQRTLYYEGRIYHNQGDESAAMECYLKALDCGVKSDDIVTKARILVAQSNIYYSLMQWNKVCDVNLQAADIFYRLDDIKNYINCNLKAVSSFIQQGEYEFAKTYLDKCSNYIEAMPAKTLGNYYSGYITYLIYDNFHRDTISKAVKGYVESVPEENIDYMTLANAYIKLEDFDNALEAASNYRRYRNTEPEHRYYALLSEIYQKQGKYKEALQHYITFNKLNSASITPIFKDDTQFMEDKHILELQAMNERKDKNIAILLSAILCVTIICVAVYIRSCLRERAMKQSLAEQEAERYRMLYQQVEYEKENLSELLSQSSDLDKETRTVVAQRLELLNKFFAVYITNNSDINRSADKELEELLANKDAFMSSTRLAFTGSHPDFIKYLEKHNLTEWEIEYCCLYALGLKGKEVGTYIKLRSHYNISSEIREKLGLGETDTNLGIYIRKLLDRVS